MKNWSVRRWQLPRWTVIVFIISLLCVCDDSRYEGGIRHITPCPSQHPATGVSSTVITEKAILNRHNRNWKTESIERIVNRSGLAIVQETRCAHIMRILSVEVAQFDKIFQDIVENDMSENILLVECRSNVWKTFLHLLFTLHGRLCTLHSS